MYTSIKPIYDKPERCVIVNDRLTDWFTAQTGVRQGDYLSPFLFTIFIIDLAYLLNMNQTGIDTGSYHLAILMYADNAILLRKHICESITKTAY